jgi:hypothetical protein
MLDPRVFDAAMQEIAERSKKAIYQRDFPAWQYDILGERTYKKMEEIGQTALLSPKPRTLIRSANGTAKTYQASRWGMWWATAFDTDQSLVILTAPTLRQVEGGLMMYMKERYGYVKRAAMAQGKRMPWPGWISEQNEWKYATPGGNMKLVVGRVPAAADAVSTLQGERKTGGRNLIIFDEAGGVSRDIFTATEALMTSGDSRMIGIGNPDRRATAFFDAFNSPTEAAEYNLFTISAYDLPTITGERVYGPGEDDKEALMLKGLTSAEWVAHKERVWMTGGEEYYDENLDVMRRRGGTPNGRFRAKVLGEFPGDADNTFFAEEDILNAFGNEITPPDSIRPVLGCDIATTGEDESVVYVNHGGRVRLFDKTISYMDGDEQRETTGVWTKEDTLTAARRINAIARYTNAREVRVDGTAVGEGVTTDLMRLPEFAEDRKHYSVVSVKGARRSSDKTRWKKWRDEVHDHLNTLMKDGRIDLDPADTQLRDELMLITYKLLDGAIKIDPKADMKTLLGGSPDRADACMYATLEVVNPPDDDPLSQLEPGQAVLIDPNDFIAERYQRDSDTYPL